jgi:hypothetical protein
MVNVYPRHRRFSMVLMGGVFYDPDMASPDCGAVEADAILRHIDAVLGVAPTATRAEITHAYRTQLRALHPDIRPISAHTTALADTQLGRVLAAYAQLRRLHCRAEANRTAEPTTTPPSPAGPRLSPPRHGPVKIPVTRQGEHPTPPVGPRPPLWAGPVRHHH